MYKYRNTDSIAVFTCIGYSVGKKRSKSGKHVQMTSLKSRGAEGGPKRTPPHLGDAG